MFRIKICGISTVEEARIVADSGADAVGLNFYPQSRRYLDPARADQVLAGLGPGLLRVGLFVNAPAAEVLAACDHCRLNLVQLHGDEPPEYLTALAGRPVMRAFRIGPAGLGPVRDYLAACDRLGCRPALVLADSQVAGQYGGAGAVAPWDVLAQWPRDGSLPPLVLAGGLTPANVAEAIAAVRPAAVDTASGVESSPGRKSADLVRAFVRAARAALERNGL